MSDSKKIIFEAKQTHYIERKLFLNEANTVDRKKIIFEASEHVCQ